MTRNIHRTIVFFAITAVCCAMAGQAMAQANPSAADKQEVVNINTASAQELALLPGIGPKKAQDIITHREKQPFKQVEDILKVKGIGRSTLKKIQAYVSVTGPTTLKRNVAGR